MFELNANNLDGLVDRMNKFATDVQKRVIGTAARNAMKPVAALAKSNARALKIDDPTTASNIIENIVSKKANKKATRRRGADYVQQVGILGGAKSPAKGNDTDELATFHWRFLEFGTSTIEARPFMRPAFERNAQRTLDIFAQEVNKGMDRAARRIAKRGQ